MGKKLTKDDIEAIRTLLRQELQTFFGLPAGGQIGSQNLFEQLGELHWWNVKRPIEMQQAELTEHDSDSSSSDPAPKKKKKNKKKKQRKYYSHYKRPNQGGNGGDGDGGAGGAGGAGIGAGIAV